jgi:3-dehydroquinate dehydratase / shikimate dehydrogenase
MICVVINGPTYEDAFQQVSKALEFADLVELRIDNFASLDFAELKILRSHFSIPMIFTLRSIQQKGRYIYSEDKRLDDIRNLMELSPEYLDLEYHIPSQFVKEICSQYPKTKLILSYHHFEETPENLEMLYQQMQKTPAFFYKIAVTAQSSLDAMRLMCWANQSENNLIAISMGYHGEISRILGPMLGTPITYASLDDTQKSAPGQLSAQTLVERYHHRTLNPQTTLYGLIGDPVKQSISDETHNHVFATLGLDAIYVKIQVTPIELEGFLEFAQQLPFRGLSVTMPLKQPIFHLLDSIDPQAMDIGAVNTLLFLEKKICGSNTDGIGALDAIEHEYPVMGKRIVIIGAGGAAKAIAYEALRRGGLVTIVNRDEAKALHIAEQLNCTGKGLEHMADCVKIGYDILINCTPASLPIVPEHIIPHTIVMDITTKPKETLFIQHAIERQCRIIYGYTMFAEQAMGQFDLWFGAQIDTQKCREALEEKVVELVPPSKPTCLQGLS